MGFFKIPVALFLFKRADKSVEIIRRISSLRPKTLYLLSDGGRNEQERLEVERCRKAVEEAIDWDCDVIKKYEESNVGVYNNIAGGAKWVLLNEENAIFLEDDNLPELTFFQFCEELLEKYKDDTRVLWICGTNYLKEYEPEDGSSYVFTKNMMPCGWATWANKFSTFYDGELSLWKDGYIRKRLKAEYACKKLYCQDKYNFDYELDALESFGKFYSWDYQMAFTMRVHNLYAIVPKVNQITNIGVDAFSTHGGSSKEDIMVERFCGLPTRPITFPLVHPASFLIDKKFEVAVAELICDPRFFSMRSILSRFIRKLFKIRKTEGVFLHIKGRFLRGRN